MKKTFFLAGLFFTLFMACKNTEKGIFEPSPGKLTYASLYNVDSIRMAILTSSGLDSEESKRESFKALSLFNQNEIDGGIALCKSAIYVYPLAETYFELGNGMIAAKNYGEALSSFHIAELMNYSPLAAVMYKIANVYSIMPNRQLCSDGTTRLNDSMALRFMEIALQMGYQKPQDFLNDKAFDSLRINNDWQFKTIYQTAKK